MTVETVITNKTLTQNPIYVPRAQALLRGRAWVAQLWAKSVGAVRLRALPFFLVQ